MYSACAHISGLAEPVGRPRNMKRSGRSGSSQTCSGSNPVGEANPSMARRYGPGGRPAASSYCPRSPVSRGHARPFPYPTNGPPSSLCPYPSLLYRRQHGPSGVSTLSTASSTRRESTIKGSSAFRIPYRTSSRNPPSTISFEGNRQREPGGRFARRKDSAVGVLGREGIVHIHREDADVMSRYPRDERPLRGHHPGFDVAFEEIGVLFEESGRRPVSPFAGEGGRADQRRDVGGDGGRGVAAGLFPPLLLCRRTVEDQVPRRPHHHRIRVEVPEVPLAQQTPRQEDGEGDLVELDPPPVRLPVDPEVLGKPAVLVLADGQVDQGAQRRLGVPRGEEARGRVDHVPRPDEVVSPAVVVPLRFPPRDRQRGDEGPGEGLVFVGEKEAVTPVIEVPAVGRRLFER